MARRTVCHFRPVGDLPIVIDRRFVDLHVGCAPGLEVAPDLVDRVTLSVHVMVCGRCGPVLSAGEATAAQVRCYFAGLRKLAGRLDLEPATWLRMAIARLTAVERVA